MSKSYKFYHFSFKKKLILFACQGQMTNKKVFSDNIAFFVQACDIGAEEEWLPPSGTRCLAHCTNITALSLHLHFDNRSQKYSQHLYRIFGAGRRKDFLAVHCTSHLGIPVYRVSFTSLRILRFFSSSVEDAVQIAHHSWPVCTSILSSTTFSFLLLWSCQKIFWGRKTSKKTSDVCLKCDRV